jgi:hypothetical protein
MRPLTQFALVVCALTGLAALPCTSRGDEIPREYRETVRKGLEWLVKIQHRDGHWEGIGGDYQVPMTAMCGMALLGEGSTMREGKYRDNIRRAVDWLMDRAQPNGLIGEATSASLGGRYMYGHGFAILFLSSNVGEEDNVRRRSRLVKILEKACKYTRDAQTSRGGWGYTSAKDSGMSGYGKDWDEGSVTATQMQALRAARNAGIIVPEDAIRDAIRYLQKSTTAEGGVIYSLANGGNDVRPALTAAAICCGFSAGEYKGEYVKKWLKFCRNRLIMPDKGRMQFHEYTHYYYGQVIYVLGDDRYKKMFPDAKADEVLTWTKYRKVMFASLKASQSADGSWSEDNWAARSVGPVYVTACYLTLLQLDKGNLPIYMR